MWILGQFWHRSDSVWEILGETVQTVSWMSGGGQQGIVQTRWYITAETGHFLHGSFTHTIRRLPDTSNNYSPLSMESLEFVGVQLL